MSSGWTYTESPWPVLRNLTSTALSLQRPSAFLGTLTADVTTTLQKMQHCQRATRRVVTMHAFLLHCLGKAAVEHPGVRTFRHRGRLITFDTVDVGTALEKRLPDGTRLPVVYIVREADRKTFAQIQWEFREAARRDLADDPGVRARRRIARWPDWLRRIALGRVLRNPFRLRQLYGNIQLTSLQQPGLRNRLLAFPASFCTLAVAAGSITQEFVPDSEGRPQLAQLLQLGGAIDHDVLDGMGAVSFARRFVELVESGAGLDDAFIEETRQRIRDRSP